MPEANFLFHFILHQLITNTIHQRLPTGLDDIIRNADGVPIIGLISSFDEDTDFDSGGLFFFTDFIINEVDN